MTPTYRPRAAYYTPDALAAALVDLVPIRPSDVARGLCVMEPHAGGGAFVRALRRWPFCRVLALDIDPAAPGLTLADDSAAVDFLGHLPTEWPRPDIVVGNPPWGPARGTAEAQVRRALEVVRPGGIVAFLLRLAMLESAERLPFWREHPARRVHVLAERPSFTGGGTDATAYGFFVWERGWQGATELDVVSWRDGRRGRAAA